MKILLTVHQFLPDFSTGTEVLTYQTAQELRRLGHDVRIITGFPAKAPMPDADRFDHYTHDGLRVDRYHHDDHAAVGRQTNRAELEYNNLFFGDWLRRYLQQWRPDVVNFFHLKRLSASAIEVCRELSIPTVYTQTDFWLICPTFQLLLPDNSLCEGPDPDGENCVRHAVARTGSPAAAAVVKRLPSAVVAPLIRMARAGTGPTIRSFALAGALSRRAGFLRQRMNLLDRVIVPTRLMYELMIRNGLDPAKAALSHFGVNYPDVARTVRGQSGALRVGFIGTLIPAKGPDVLLDAASRLHDEPALEINIYGDMAESSQYIEKLRHMAQRDGRVRFCGTFRHDRIGAILADIDVLVVPSIWYENTPLVLYFAQAAGCPVIATGLGGMAEVIRHEENGLLFEPGDAGGLAAALRRLARDRELLRNLAHNAKRPKSIAEYAAELLALYREVRRERGMEA